LLRSEDGRPIAIQVPEARKKPSDITNNAGMSLRPTPDFESVVVEYGAYVSDLAGQMADTASSLVDQVMDGDVSRDDAADLIEDAHIEFRDHLDAARDDMVEWANQELGDYDDHFDEIKTEIDAAFDDVKAAADDAFNAFDEARLIDAGDADDADYDAAADAVDNIKGVAADAVDRIRYAIQDRREAIDREDEERVAEHESEVSDFVDDLGDDMSDDAREQVEEFNRRADADELTYRVVEADEGGWTWEERSFFDYVRKSSQWEESKHPRAEDGKFGSGGGGGGSQSDSGGSASGDSSGDSSGISDATPKQGKHAAARQAQFAKTPRGKIAAKREAADAKIAAKRDAVRGAIDDKRNAIETRQGEEIEAMEGDENALAEARGKEDAAIEEARDKEDAKFGDDGPPDDVLDARGAEDDKLAAARDKEDEKLAAKREKMEAKHAAEIENLDERLEAIEAKWEDEDAELEDARGDEDAELEEKEGREIEAADELLDRIAEDDPPIEKQQEAIRKYNLAAAKAGERTRIFWYDSENANARGWTLKPVDEFTDDEMEKWQPDTDPVTKSSRWEEDKHPRAEDGKFGGGGGKGRASSPKAEAKQRREAVTQTVRQAAQQVARSAAGIAAAAPEKMRAVATALSTKYAGLKDKAFQSLPQSAQIGITKALAVAHAIEKPLEKFYHGGQKAAESVARAYGLNESQVAALGQVLGAADAVSRWTANVPVLHEALHVVAHVGGPAGFVAAKAGFYLPVASLAFVATAGGGLAAFKAINAARKAIRATIGRRAGAKAMPTDERGSPANILAKAMIAKKFDERYQALLMAALDETGDLAKAIRAADEAFEGDEAAGQN
jgi:hypothetical protein